jgi:hypothetical protein
LGVNIRVDACRAGALVPRDLRPLTQGIERLRDVLGCIAEDLLHVRGGLSTRDRDRNWRRRIVASEGEKSLTGVSRRVTHDWSIRCAGVKKILLGLSDRHKARVPLNVGLDVCLCRHRRQSLSGGLWQACDKKVGGTNGSATARF